ncbi:MAG: HAMP domain-containing protein, partial [Elusimicrobia bacterium]|nr:HAMP domain-containing protein [Elusimicrobiota bacterium]
MIFKKSLALKLELFILAGTSLVFLGAFAYNYYFSRQITLAHVREDMQWTAQDSLKRINTALESVELMPQYAAMQIERGGVGEASLWGMLEDLVKSHPMIYGSTASYEPYAFSRSRKLFAPYVYEKGKDLLRASLATPSYNYQAWQWYMRPRESGKPQWSEPYFDEGGGNIPMCTYSVPFYAAKDGKKTFSGVVTADISLDWLVDLASSIQITRSGYAFMVSRKGLLIAHPDKSLVMRGTLAGFAEKIKSPALLDVAEKISAGEEGFARIRLEGDYWQILFIPIPRSGWALGIMAPEKELFADISELGRNVLLIGGIGFALLFLIASCLSRNFVNPIRLLAGSTAEIAKGNLDAALPAIRSEDELGELSHSFEEMRVALKEYIADLARTTAAKERIESELKIARAIQMNFLPKKFPVLDADGKFLLDARLEPAKMVGGDFYDFFMLDDDNLFFSIGDVSDKGVPAALFMAVTKTLMKGIAAPGMEPCEVLR